MASSAHNSSESSDYVTLVSSDGFEFIVLREAACISGMIKTMLAGKQIWLFLMYEVNYF